VPSTPPAAGGLVAEPLPRQLIDATRALLSELGLAGVTLRGVAKRAGVSHTAPLKHFASFADLLTETAATGFELLRERVDEAGAALPPGAGSRARLVAASKAYVATAIDHPALFTLMFRFDLLDRTNPSYTAASMSAYRDFLRYVRAVQDDGWQTHAATETVNATVWSLVHGIATLWSHGALAASVNDVATLDEIIDGSLQMIIEPHSSAGVRT
jgi:AcrR family transcriptional regulator